jgi:hypothetical protein
MPLLLDVLGHMVGLVKWKSPTTAISDRGVGRGYDMIDHVECSAGIGTMILSRTIAVHRMSNREVTPRCFQ